MYTICHPNFGICIIYSDYFRVFLEFQSLEALTEKICFFILYVQMFPILATALQVLS